MSSPLLAHVSAGSRPRFNDGSTEFSQHRQNNSVPEHCEDSLQNSTEDVEKSPKPSTLCEKLRSSVWGLTYVYQTFWIAAINSLLAPFFPALAASRGNNTWLFGATFSVFHVLMLPGSFLAEILIIKKSLKFAYLIAITGFTIYASLCGAIYWIDEENSFVGVAIFNAAFGGTAMAIFLVSVVTVFTSDRNGGLWMGIKENVSGIGALLGQVGGGFFIDHWKYPTPFFAFTIALVLVIPFIKVPRSGSLEEKDESPVRADQVNEECDQGDIVINDTHSHLQHSQPKNRYKLLLDPMFLVNIGNVVMASCLAAYNEATLQPYLVQFNLSSTEVGAVFTVKSCGLSFGPLIAGMLTVYKMEQFYIIFGQVLIAIALLIVGPAPFLPFQPNAAGYPNDLKTTSFISSSACRCMLLGGMIMPPIATFIVTGCGYRKGSMFMLGTLSFFMLITAGSWLTAALCAPNARFERDSDRQTLWRGSSENLGGLQDSRLPTTLSLTDSSVNHAPA
uniref:Putative mfs-type transporter n=1 Tax=Ixodes ricinus TaxID=34613 RepID=A0A6B0VE41_IXORI